MHSVVKRLRWAFQSAFGPHGVSLRSKLTSKAGCCARYQRPEGGIMSRRLMQLVIPVTPERRMFRIHDPAVDPDAPGGPLPPVGALISTNRQQLWVGSLQEDINVRLVLE